MQYFIYDSSIKIYFVQWFLSKTRLRPLVEKNAVPQYRVIYSSHLTKGLSSIHVISNGSVDLDSFSQHFWWMVRMSSKRQAYLFIKQKQPARPYSWNFWSAEDTFNKWLCQSVRWYTTGLLKIDGKISRRVRWAFIRASWKNVICSMNKTKEQIFWVLLIKLLH